MSTPAVSEDPQIGATGTAIVRTVAPMIAGVLLTLLAKAGLNLTEPAVEAALVPILGALYYTGVLWLQNHVSPAFGWLLGSPAVPVYDPPITVVAPATPEAVPLITDLPDETPPEPYVDRPAAVEAEDDQ